MTDYQTIYDEHGGFLWGYCYRLTGNAAEAEDLVHDTFVRAMERPPADTDRPWRPWLVRVATNMRHDAFRRQKVREYSGPWLPSPIDTDANTTWQLDAEGRYQALESVTFAFLLALEALTPQQRAVLLLRDVYDYSVAEAADALDLSEANVKTTLYRARKAIDSYDETRRPPTDELAERTRAMLERFLHCFAKADAKAMEELLAEDTQSIHDAAGEFIAAGVPIVGREKVALFYSRIVPPNGEEFVTRLTMLNGLPAVLTERPHAPEGLAKRWTYTVLLDDEGKIFRSYAVLATSKLTAIAFT